MGRRPRGHKGPSLDYRKMEGLEQDPLFLTHMQRPLFRDICARVYGAGTAISCYRAMFMNKPAGKGTVLPWHQDRWNELDRSPRVTIWTALDDSTVENGCMTVLTGSHKLGLINESSAFFTEEQGRDLEARFDSVVLEFQAGESVVLHNWLLHTSGVNRTDRARRAFSVAYMEAAHASQQWSRVFRHFRRRRHGPPGRLRRGIPLASVVPRGPRSRHHSSRRLYHG